MTIWPKIPTDVRGFVRRAFGEANRQVTELIWHVPNVRETSLDDQLINALTPRRAPTKLPSGAVVEMDIHNIGGLRHLYSWETADIAILVFIYRDQHLVAQKIGLLQSKRMYPENGDVEDTDRVGFAYGMNKMLHKSQTSPLRLINRKYIFNEDCSYLSIKHGDKQIDTIDTHNREFGESIYYLLYMPPTLPSTVHYPLVSHKRLSSQFDFGCLVYPAPLVHEVLAKLKKGRSPTHRQLTEMAGGKQVARLETWVADSLLICKAGQQFDSDKEEQVSRMLERRTGPIAASIAISIALPPE
jgi:hypothetical protein